MTDLLAKGQLDPPTMASLAAQYGTELDFASVPELLATHGLVFPGGPLPE